MLKSELLMTILTAYLESSELCDEAQSAAEKFCAYADSWFQNNPPVGLGHSFGGGLSVRFADGQEFLLFENQTMSLPANLPAMNITGQIGGSVRAANAAQTDTSMSITGKN